ncbi:hypothetical protein [Aridibaculum aurantiacum]|uniref:hypothetical protein n=1 Tax=Aridibaculum aurantiacum TaxID=2810307 RepID=UPI001A95B7A8|nr:hypothetical protein [Aridibaculum aurantiacum]
MKLLLPLLAFAISFNLFAQDSAGQQNPTSSIWPATSMNNPSGGGSLGTLIVGATFHEKTRLGTKMDGHAGAYLGLGDPIKYIGAGATVNIYGLSNSKGEPENLGSGGLDLHINRFFFKQKLMVDAGVQNLVLWGIHPSFINYITYQRSYYVAANYLLKLSKKSYSSPFSYLSISAGAGNGFYVQDAKHDITRGGKMNPFFSLATPILPSTNLIGEWTGYDYAFGISTFPFPKVPLGINIEVTDIKYQRLRYIFGIAYNLQLLHKASTSSRPVGTKLIRPARTL